MILASPAAAQIADSPPGEIVALTPAQKRAVLDDAAEGRTRADGLTMSGNGDGRIHGEVGAMIGTGGARGVFGTAAIPLGEDAGAVVSFESSRYGRSRIR